MSDHLRSSFDEASDVAGMILVHVGDEHEFHRLIGDRLDLRHEVVVRLIAQVLRVDENDALVRHAHGAVAAEAGDHVKAGLDHLDGHRCGWRSASLPGGLAAALACAPAAAFPGMGHECRRQRERCHRNEREECLSHDAS